MERRHLIWNDYTVHDFQVLTQLRIDHSRLSLCCCAVGACSCLHALEHPGWYEGCWFTFVSLIGIRWISNPSYSSFFPFVSSHNTLLCGWLTTSVYRIKHFCLQQPIAECLAITYREYPDSASWERVFFQSSFSTRGFTFHPKGSPVPEDNKTAIKSNFMVCIKVIK